MKIDNWEIKRLGDNQIKAERQGWGEIVGLRDDMSRPPRLVYDLLNEILNDREDPERTTPVRNGDLQVLRALAFRTLWIAYVWNDHNFEPAERIARATCENVGIKSFEDANQYLEDYKAPFRAQTPEEVAFRAAEDALHPALKTLREKRGV